MDDLVRENLLDHYQAPRHHGRLPGCDATAEGQNPLCGDEVVVDLRIADGVVADIAFEGRGCAISQATMSMLTDEVMGKSVEEVAQLTAVDMLDLLGFPLNAARVKCAVLGLATVKVALHRHSGTPLPEGVAGLDEVEWR